MADIAISALPAALTANLVGTSKLPAVDGTAGTTGPTFAQIRTAMFAGSTGYTATDPLTVGAISTSGDFAVATSKFTVAAATGNTLVAGTLGASGDFAIATSKFTVASASGNTVVAGTLAVTGITGIGAANPTGTQLYVQVAATGISGTFTDATNSTFKIDHPSSGVMRFLNGSGNPWLSESSLNVTLPSTTQSTSTTTGALVVSGGAGFAKAVFLGETLSVTGTSTLTGNVGVGGSIDANVGVSIKSAALTTTYQIGLQSDPTVTSAATAGGYAMVARVRTAAASFTMSAGYGLSIEDAIKGAGSTITTLYGLYIAAQTAGATNYAIKCNGGHVDLALPTSSAGLPSGALWSNGGVVTVA